MGAIDLREGASRALKKKRSSGEAGAEWSRAQRDLESSER